MALPEFRNQPPAARDSGRGRRIGFMGFGGAAYGLSKGLKTEGPVEIWFYDPLNDHPSLGSMIRQRAGETGAVSVMDLEQLAEKALIIISCVTGSVAVEVARQAAPYLRPQHLYVDVNTASPVTMEAVADAIKSSGASAVDVAMMGAVPAFLHRVPCLASGNGTELFVKMMRPFNMDITCVGNLFGQASAIKMFRSIFMKGLLALLMEMLSATHRYRVDAIVLESIRKTMEQNDFLETVRLQLAKGVVSAERMGHEMEAVVQTLADMGLPSQMASAAREKLQWCSSLNLVDELGHDLQAELPEILDVLDSKARR
jgi:3-hydroxyisobutyrate dehydrogenase-like beta-hydroxyacid dehydrogenase